MLERKIATRRDLGRGGNGMASKRDLPDYYEFADVTYGMLLDRVAAEVPENEFIVFKDQRVTYSEFRSRVLQIAMALKRLGMQKGDRVGVLYPSCAEYFYIQQAVLYIGGIFTPLSTRYRKFEITYMMKHAGARFMFCVDEYMGTRFVDILEEVRTDLPEMETIIVRGQSVPVWAKSYEEVFALGEEMDEKQLRADLPSPRDTATILYTSGSTGMPKGAVATHRAHMWNSMGVCERLEPGPNDVFLMMLPCTFIFGCFVQFTNVIMGRSKVVIMENFEAGEALRLQEAERVTIHYGVPTMFTLMLHHPEFDRFDLSSNRAGYISGAACPAELIRAIQKDMHCSISEGYGMTENCGCISLTHCDGDEDLKANTAGPPNLGVDLKIIDDHDKALPIGEVGEIAVKGEALFSGYYKQPELTKESFTADGYFRTGDLAKLDENGMIVVAGRKKEMLIRGGFNVFPAEVEEHIAKFEGVQHVAVVGVPDQKLGEKICACIVPKHGARLNEDEIVNFCKKDLANYKIPDLVEIMETFPLTSTEKIQKFKIKEMMGEKHGTQDS
jgi:acyl-CoA synthetase (AMP-forming)/AMP-acid ligase II